MARVAGYGTGLTAGPRLSPSRIPAATSGSTSQVPPVPTTWPGSDLEWMVFWALTKPLSKTQDVDFTYQAARFGGKAVAGGIAIDFLMMDGTGIGMDIEGEYWHYGNATEISSALIRRERCSNIHINLIFIDGADVKNSVVYYVKEALAGVDHSKLIRM